MQSYWGASSFNASQITQCCTVGGWMKFRILLNTRAWLALSLVCVSLALSIEKTVENPFNERTSRLTYFSVTFTTYLRPLGARTGPDVTEGCAFGGIFFCCPHAFEFESRSVELRINKASTGTLNGGSVVHRLRIMPPDFSVLTLSLTSQQHKSVIITGTA